MGIAVAGLTSDARLLCKYMRNECLNHKFVYESPHDSYSLIFKIAESTINYYQNLSRKLSRHPNDPMGLVFLLLLTMYKFIHQNNGTHLYETQPNGEFF